MNLHQYVSLTKSSQASKESTHEIVVTLECPEGHLNCNTVRRWRTILRSKKRVYINNYCEQCVTIPQGRGLGDDAHLERVRSFHPKATYSSDSNSGALTAFSCNETEYIGTFAIPHPTFYASPTKIAAEMKKNSPTRSGYCLPCAIAKGLTPPGSDKHIEHHLCRLQMRAAFIATLNGTDTTDTASVTKSDGTTTGKVKSNENLSFQCHNPEHPPITRTPDNFFSKYKKGYCPKCLAESGVKTFRELTNKY